jgi:Protein of unknown function (DUF2950)
MAAPRAGRRPPIVRLERVKTFLSKGTGRKPARAIPHHADNRLAAVIAVPLAGIVLLRVAAEIEALRPAQAHGQAAVHSVGPAVVRLAPAVPAAVRAWALGVAADAGGRGSMREKQMNFESAKKLAGITRMYLISAALALLLPIAIVSGQQSDPAQLTFATPEKAAAALIQACETFDVPELMKILGPYGEDLVSSEDPVRDKNIAVHFAAEAHEHTSISVDPNNSNRATLIVGNDDFPLAIPIVHKNGTWFFDTKAGREEVLYRRIGANELDALQICRGYVESQHEYAMTKHDGAEVNQYAQRIISTPGKHDGLVWRNSDGTLGGPIAENIADVIEQGYSDKAKPYHGYFFKILKGQGPAAPLGQMNFVVEGAMIGGFALAAAPAEYRVTGVKTFIVGYDGIVYQKDLGPDTLKIFKDMELYNPDKSWTPTEDSWPPDLLDASIATQN